MGILITFFKWINISKGNELFKKFKRYLQLSPKIIITDNSLAERNNLQKAIPYLDLLLCKFHIFQIIWWYLLDSKHNIEKKILSILILFT